MALPLPKYIDEMEKNLDRYAEHVRNFMKLDELQTE